MKNRVLSLLFGTALLFGSFALMSFQQQTDAEVEVGDVIAIERMGSTYSQTQNTNCPSGIAHQCTGQGNLCRLTIGWDCK